MPAEQVVGQTMYLHGEVIAYAEVVTVRSSRKNYSLIDEIDRVNWLTEFGDGLFWFIYSTGENSTRYFFTDASTAFHFKMRWR